MMLRRFLRDTSGVAAAEMVLVLPGFALIMLNVFDLGVYLYTRMQVDLAAQEAVGAARVLCNTAAELPAKTNCGGTLDSTMLAAARSTSLGNTVSLGTSSEAWFCATSGGVLNQVAALGATVPSDCSATVTGSTVKPGDYISVSASYTFAPIFPQVSVAAAMPSTITRTAWIRLQ